MEGDTVGVMHDYGGAGVWNRVTRVGFAFVLQWADPLGASENDYDLFLVDAVRDSVIAFSNTTQDGTQDPIEFIGSNNLDYQNTRLVIVKHAGADRHLRLDTLDGQLARATAGNTLGHSAAENMIGVGMVDIRTAGGPGGADRALLDINSSTGDLTFRSVPNYEDPQDTWSTDPQNDAGNNEYVVTVTATSRVGTRSKTANRMPAAIQSRNLPMDWSMFSTCVQ